MIYSSLKLIHISCVVLTLISFSLRYIFRWLNIQTFIPNSLPHWIDSVLFFSGLSMAWMIHQYPFVSPWLTAKLLALLLYILFGHIALKNPSYPISLFAALCAYLSFAYIVHTALYKSAAFI